MLFVVVYMALRQEWINTNKRLPHRKIIQLSRDSLSPSETVGCAEYARGCHGITDDEYVTSKRSTDSMFYSNVDEPRG